MAVATDLIKRMKARELDAEAALNTEQPQTAPYAPCLMPSVPWSGSAAAGHALLRSMRGGGA